MRTPKRQFPSLRGLAALFLAASCGSDDGGPALRIFKGAAVNDGVVMGYVLDDLTEAPVPAEVIVGGTPVRARPDGSFEAANTPAGRVRVEVRSDGYLKTHREVAVGGKALPMPFKIAKKEMKKVPGSMGASLQFREAFLDVPLGAYRDGVGVALTYLDRVRIAAIASNPQFIDDAGIPRRAVALVDVDEPPAMPVKVRVPVPTDASMESVAGFVIDGSGQWTTTIDPIFVGGGFAEFTLKNDLQIGVAVDVRKADGRRVGYLVTESGDTGSDQGEVIRGGQDVNSVRRPASITDQRGSRVEVAPGTRARVEVPTGEMGTAGVAPYAGQVAVTAGRARVVVPPGDEPNVAKLIKMTVKGNAASFEAKGTAFTVTTCSPPTAADLIEVVEGLVTVKSDTGTTTVDVSEGETAVACTKCTPGAAPVCLDENDGGVLGDVGAGGGSLDSSAGGGGDAVAAETSSSGDAPATESGPAVEAGATVDAPVTATDTGTTVTPDAGAGPDAAIRADAAAPTPDARVSPDTTQPPPPDAAPPPPDAPAPQPDMMVIMPQPDTAPPVPDMAFDTASIGMDASPAAFGINPASFTYPTTLVNGSSLAADFIVTNYGQTASDTPGVSTTGDFAVTSNGCTGPVLAGASCTIAVAFRPRSAGTLTGTLRVLTSDLALSTSALQGVGMNPPQPARFEITPATADFGWLYVNAASKEVEFTIRNAGELESAVPMFALGGPGEKDFILMPGLPAAPCPNKLPPQGTCTVPMVFFPQSVTGPYAVKQATLTVSGSPGGSDTTIMNGGALAHFQMEARPGSRNLGSAKVGDSTPGVDVILVNTSTTILQTLVFDFPQTPDLEIKNGCSANGIPTGGQCTISFSFKPSAVGRRDFNWGATAINGRTGAQAIAGGHLYGTGL